MLVSLKDPPHYSGTEKDNNEPKLDIDSLITLELLLHILECKVECLGLSHFTRSSQLLREGEEFMVIPSIIE